VTKQAEYGYGYGYGYSSGYKPYQAGTNSMNSRPHPNGRSAEAPSAQHGSR